MADQIHPDILANLSPEEAATLTLVVRLEGIVQTLREAHNLLALAEQAMRQGEQEFGAGKPCGHDNPYRRLIESLTRTIDRARSNTYGLMGDVNATLYHVQQDLAWKADHNERQGGE